MNHEPRTTNQNSFEFIEESGGISAYRLPSNGLQVLLLSDTTAPVVTFMITYHVGSRNEVSGYTGATHLLEHLMFKGTEQFNKKKGTSVFNVLQRVGAQINATTWFDRTNYYELLPKEHLPLAIEIEADRMRNALISEEDLASERTVVLNEFDRAENEPLRKLYHAVWSTAFFAHPYHHPTLGWRSDIESVTAERLRHFYDTYYWPNNATVSVIGDFDRDEALALISDTFGEIPASPHVLPEVVTREPAQRGERRVSVRMAGQLGAVMAAFKSPPALDEETDALDVLAVIMASGKSSRLYRRLTSKGLTTNVFASASRLRDPGISMIYATLAPDVTHERVEKEILTALADVQNEGVTTAEVQRAKNQLFAQEAFGRDGTFAVASQLNEAIAAGSWKLYTTYMDRIGRVTPESVQEVAAKHLTEDQRTIGHYVPVLEEAA